LPDFSVRREAGGGLPEGGRSQSSSLTYFPYAQAIRSLLEQGRIREAQSLFEHSKDFIQDPKLHKALAPPRVKVGSKRDVDRSAEFRWLDLNNARFRDKWVALLGENLVASADSLKGLLAELKTLTLEAKPLIHHLD
jgi:hypothetical protein